MENRTNFFHLHLISDSTGETLISAGRAASAQFKSSQPIEHVYPLIRNRKQLMPVLQAIDSEPGIVLYTIVDPELASIIDERCAEMGVASVNVLEPVIGAFQIYLGAPSRRRVGSGKSNAELRKRKSSSGYWTRTRLNREGRGHSPISHHPSPIHRLQPLQDTDRQYRPP